MNHNLKKILNKASIVTFSFLISSSLMVHAITIDEVLKIIKQPGDIGFIANQLRVQLGRTNISTPQAKEIILTFQQGGDWQSLIPSGLVENITPPTALPQTARSGVAPKPSKNFFAAMEEKRRQEDEKEKKEKFHPSAKRSSGHGLSKPALPSKPLMPNSAEYHEFKAYVSELHAAIQAHNKTVWNRIGKHPSDKKKNDKLRNFDLRVQENVLSIIDKKLGENKLITRELADRYITDANWIAKMYNAVMEKIDQMPD